MAFAVAGMAATAFVKLPLASSVLLSMRLANEEKYTAHGSPRAYPAPLSCTAKCCTPTNGATTSVGSTVNQNQV